MVVNPDDVVLDMKPGETYEVESTDDAGLALFTNTPSSPGTMFVTVTAPDHLPCEDSCLILPPHDRLPSGM